MIVLARGACGSTICSMRRAIGQFLLLALGLSLQHCHGRPLDSPRVQVTSAVHELPTAPGVPRSVGSADPSPEPSPPVAPERPWLQLCGDSTADVPWLAAKTELVSGVPVTVLGHHEDAVAAVAFIDSTTVVSVGGDSVVHVWSICRPSEAQSYSLSSEGTALAVRGDGLVAVGTTRGDVFSLRAGVEKPKLFARVGKGIKTVSFSLDGKHLAVGGFSESVQIFDASSRRHLRTMGRGYGLVYSVAWARPGNVLAIGGHDGTVGLFELDERGPVRETKLGVPEATAWTPSVVFDCESRHLFAARNTFEDNDDVVQVWDVASRQLQQEWVVPTGITEAIAATCGGLVATGGWDAVSVRNRDGKVVAILQDAEETIRALAFSPDGNYLVSGSGRGKLHGRPGDDNTVRLYWVGDLAQR